MRILIVIILMLLTALAHGQTHTMPGSNVVPSGASLTINSGGSITAAAGSTVTGFGGGAVSLTATTPIIVTPSPTTGTGVISLNATSKSNWDTAFTQMLQWDGGATNLVAATGRTSLALNNVTNNAQTQAAIVPNTAPAAGQLLVGNAGGTAYAPQTLSGSGATISLASTGVMTISGITGVPTAANPTAKVGTSAVNGSASTFMRSDGAPPIDQTVDLAMTAAQSITLSDSATNTTPNLLTLGHNSSATPLATFGTGILLRAKDSTTADQSLAGITGAWISPTHGSAQSSLSFNVVSSGALASPMVLKGTGSSNVASLDFANGSSGFTWSGAATTGLILQANGTRYVPSSATWPTDTTLGKMVQGSGSNFVASAQTWPTAAGTVGYTVRSDGTNFASYPTQLSNASTANLTTSTADIYLAGSSIALTAGDFKAKGQYHCVFDMAKTAGTGAIIVTVRVGTTGTVASDAAILTFTFGAGTAVADSGVFEVWASFRTVGSGTSAVMVGGCQVNHQLATTGLISNAATWPIIGVVSSGFNSSTATTIGVSFNGSTAFAGTNTLVQATMEQ